MKKLELRDVLAVMIRYIAVLMLCITLPMSCSDSKVDDEGGNKQEQPKDDPDEPKDDPDEPKDDPEDPDEPEEPTGPYDRVIGYLVYTAFEAAYDDDLRAEFDKFKEAGVTDIIIDLRYNGGGHVSSSEMLASILAGNKCAGKVFAYERYNDERMKKRKRDPKDYTTYERRMFQSATAQKYGFDFKTIYVIGTNNTASASELTINALRGIDQRVVLVGCENTNGKDVGMEVYSPVRAYGGYYYELAPISFQSYNAKGESDYDNGFAPDLNTGVDSKGYTYEDYVPEDWGFPMEWGYNMREDAVVPNYDYLIDAVQDILGSTFLYGDIEILKSESSNIAGVSSTSELRKVKRKPLATAATRGGSQLVAKLQQPLRNNMYVIREYEPTRAEINADVNQEVINAQMDTLYLWNEAYRQTAKNYQQDYQSFLQDVLSQMYKKGQNLQDGYRSGTKWYFYTYIYRYSRGGLPTRAATKETKHGFGVDLLAISFDGIDVEFLVQYVYPDSPAAKAGIVRGDLISKVNGNKITADNFNYTYLDLLYDEFSRVTTYTFSFYDKSTSDKTVTTASFYPTPIVFSSIYRIANK